MKKSKLVEIINDRIACHEENRIEICNHHVIDGTPADKMKCKMIDFRTGNIESLQWVLEQLKTKKKKTSDYEGCKTYERKRN